MRLSPTAEQTPADPTAPVTYKTGQLLLADFERTGSEHSFEEIVRLYAGMVFSVCQHVTKNAHDAEDATQATFLALATQVKLGKQVKCLGPWLRQVAKRTSLDLCKSRKRREKRESAHGDFTTRDRFNGNAGEANLESQDYKTALHDELNKLPTRYRLPLVMHYFGGLPPEQTAIELNCKPKTLAVRLHRGRKMLAAQLSRRGIYFGGEALGLASAPMMYQLMGGSIAHSTAHATAHAAVGLTSGMDITSMISSRVMALVNGSAKAAILAKIKFLAIALVLFSTVLTGAAQSIRVMSPLGSHFPRINFHISEWISPLLRAVAPSGKLMAQATPASADQSAAPLADQSNLAFGSSQNLSLAGAGITLASYDPSDPQGGDYQAGYQILGNASLASMKLPNNGSIQFRRISSPVAASDNTVADSTDLGAPTVYRTLSVQTSPTPEPFGTAAIVLAGSFLLRRRPNAKRPSK